MTLTSTTNPNCSKADLTALEELSHHLDLLHYHAAWLEYGFLEATLLHEQIATYQSGQDHNTEHYRYAAFRHVLASRSHLTDAELAHYLHLAQLDADRAMAQSALYSLLLWHGLTADQFEALAQQPIFTEPLFQKLILRQRLLVALMASPITAETFERCLASDDAAIQRRLVALPELSSEQLQNLATQGATRAVRNMAQAQKRKP